MTHDPTLRALADINPVQPEDVAGGRNAEWAVAERNRILAVDRSAGVDDRTGRRTMSRRVTGSLVTVGALAGIAALSVAVWVGGGDDAPPAPAGAAVEIGVLERPRTAGDALPEWVRRHRNLRPAHVVISTSRRTVVFGGRSLFVARTNAGGVCLIDVRADASADTSNPGGITCQPRVAMADSFVVSRLSGGDGPRGITAIGIVPDGFTRVKSGPTTAAVTANTFVLSRVRPSDPIVAEGPSGRRVETVDRFGSHLSTASGRRLPVAALASDAPAGGRSVRIDERLYSMSRRSRAGGITINERVVERDGSLSRAGQRSVRWPTEGAPLSLTVSMMVGPAREATAMVTGIAPDGYDQVTIGGRSAPVRRNLVVVGGIRFTAADGLIEAVATGPAGTLRVPVVAMPPQTRTPLRPSASP